LRIANAARCSEPTTVTSIGVTLSIDVPKMSKDTMKSKRNASACKTSERL